MQVFATYNIKGGVGKTATAVNLAFCAAQQGSRTLVWDLDPQGAATFYFRIKPKVKGGSKGIVQGKKDLDRLIKGSDYENLDLLPADFSYRNMDLLLDEEKKPTRNFKKSLKSLATDYDYIFLDCPPGISLLSENVFQAANALLVPIIPTILSQRTLQQLTQFLQDSEYKKLQLWPFFSIVDRRKKLHRELLETLPQENPAMLKTSIPNSSEVERMGINRKPLLDFAAGSVAAKAYLALWHEIKSK